MRITVGIRTRLLESVDGGRTWTEGTRTVPDPSEPTLLGLRDGFAPPVAPTGWTMSHVHVSSEGIGLAAGCASEWRVGGPKSPAKFWRTADGGARWEPIEPDIGRWGRMRAGSSWPPDDVDSVSTLTGGLQAFAWEDPWFDENPHCHLVLSDAGPSRWRYVRLPDGCGELGHGPGPLRVFGPGRVVVRSDSGAFRREPIQAEWKLPPPYFPPGGWPGRLIQFMSEQEGFAIRVSWPRDQPPKTPEELPPPMVGLSHTQDGGRRWEVMATWEGPRADNFNRRHEVTLEVR